MTAPTARQHRKQLAPSLRWQNLQGIHLHTLFWAPGDPNWRIGFVFAVGAKLFALASFGYLVPTGVPEWLRSPEALNLVYFLGSIPFTLAALLQLLQAETSGAHPAVATGQGSWRWRSTGWMSSATQFAGTLLFNVNTFNAMRGEGGWWVIDLEVWLPDLLGSVLFLVSGYLAYKEVVPEGPAWEPQFIESVITHSNFAGCIAFMISAVLAVTLPSGMPAGLVTVSILFTLLGALGFLLGAVLLMVEAAISRAHTGLAGL
ncbi:MAG: hypothetical protein AAGA91_16260 [Pseudomonadota bacterium]